MEVVCEGCGSKYKIDSSKINGPNAWFKCQGCSKPINVDRQNPAEAPNPSIGSDLPVTESFTDPIVQSPPEKSYRFGLTAKVVILMLLVSLIPGGIYFALSSKLSHERILSESEDLGIMISAQLSSQVDMWIDKNVRALKTLAHLPGIRSMNADQQESVLKSLQNEYPWMYLTFTADINGRNIARSDGKSLRDYANRQYVKDIASGSELAWQTLIGKTSKKPALVLAVPIKSRGRIVGLLAAAMTREAISKRITTFKQGKTGSSFLVDQTGRVVAHRDNALVMEEQDMSIHPLINASQSGRKGKIEFIDANGKTAIGFTKTTGLGWILAIQQEKSEALEPLKEARFFAFALLGGTLLVVVLIALFASRTIVRPITELTDAANRISVGDMDVEINTRSKDEIGDLAEAVTRLQDSIRISISRMKRLKR